MRSEPEFVTQLLEALFVYVGEGHLRLELGRSEDSKDEFVFVSSYGQTEFIAEVLHVLFVEVTVESKLNYRFGGKEVV